MRYRKDLLKLKEDEYIFDMDILKGYEDISTSFLCNVSKMNGKEALSFIRKHVEEHDVAEPIVTYYKKDNKGDSRKLSKPLIEYIKENINKDYIITPTLTILQQHTKKLSLHTEFTTRNKENRSKEKKEAFKYKVIGNFSKFDYHNTLQKTLKIFNNSLSGGYVSKSTIIRNEAAHSVLTSVTRCVTSVGNALTEDIVAGNRQYRNPDITINHLSEIVYKVDKYKYGKIIQKYNLHIPSNDELIQTILRSTSKYFESKSFEFILREFISNLNNAGRCAIMYNTSLYNLSIYNPTLIRTILSEISELVTEKVQHPLVILENMPEYILGLVHHICNNDIKGINPNYRDLEKDNIELLNQLASTAKHVYVSIAKYEDLFKMTLITDVFPPSMSYVPEIVRESCLVSDTDSTIATYQYWIEFMLGTLEMTPRAIAVADTVATLNGAVIEHFIYMFVTALNVKGEYKGILEMKPELFMNVFVPANVSKTYYSNYSIQEGRVFKTPLLDIKGVHLIGSNMPPKYSKTLHNMMEEVFEKVMKCEKISMYEYITTVSTIEKELLKEIKSGSGLVYPITPLKELDAYLTKEDIQEGLTAYNTKYYGHMMWDEVFKDKYGMSDSPPYSTIQIPMNTKSKIELNKMLSNMDISMKENMLNVMDKGNKKDIPSIKIPYAYASIKGVPKEILPYVNSKKVVHNVLNGFYIMLETLGFYKKKDILISDYYIN